MTTTITERADALVTELQALTNWQDRYRRIIALGRELAPMPDAHRVDTNKVKGCQSQVWLHASLGEDADGRAVVEYVADSDAAIVKGLVAIVLDVYSGATPDEVLQTPPSFIDALGLSENLSQTRANGLQAMIKQIKLYAVAFSALAARATPPRP